ncbi:MAG: hypothetical protein U1F76_03175 [Candidatus Competibacteraceae bacterium]
MIKKISDDGKDPHSRQSRSTFVERASRRMVDLASQLVWNPERSDRQFGRLADLIEKYLAAGEDQVIQRALERAPDFRVHDEIVNDVLNCIEWQTISGENAEPIELILFAVPLHLILHARADRVAIPWTLPQVDLLVKSFRRHGLVGRAPTVLLYNYLYAFTELEPLPYSKRYRLPQRLLKTFGGSRPVDLFQHYDYIALPPGEAHLLLRFIVGLVLQGPEDRQPFADITETEDSHLERIAGWAGAFAREVEQQLHRPDLEIICCSSLPALLQSALQEGHHQHRELALQLLISQAIDENGSAVVLSAFIVLPTKQPTLTLILTHKATEMQVLHYPWQLAPWDDPQVIVASISAALGQAGIDDIQLGEQAPCRLPYLH